MISTIRILSTIIFYFVCQRLIPLVTMANLTACRDSELSARVSPAYFPLSFASLAGSPVFTVENSNEML
jgi:hypothetical protein